MMMIHVTGMLHSNDGDAEYVEPADEDDEDDDGDDDDDDDEDGTDDGEDDGAAW